MHTHTQNPRPTSAQRFILQPDFLRKWGRVRLFASRTLIFSTGLGSETDSAKLLSFCKFKKK